MEAQSIGASSARQVKWSAEQREQMVAESRQPGASVSEVAQRHGVRTALLSAWRRKAASRSMGKSTAFDFAAVQLSSVSSEGVPTTRCRPT